MTRLPSPSEKYRGRYDKMTRDEYEAALVDEYGPEVAEILARWSTPEAADAAEVRRRSRVGFWSRAHRDRKARR